MKRSTRDRWWVGIPLIAIGALILFRQLGYDIDIGYVFRTYWPVFLIWWGVKGLTEIWRNDGYAAIGPVVVLAIGGFFLARNLGVIGYSFGEFIRYLIPILLIGGGLYVLIGPGHRDRKHPNNKMETPSSPPEQPYQPMSPQDLEMPSSFDEEFEKTFGKPKQEPASGKQQSFHSEEEQHQNMKSKMHGQSYKQYNQHSGDQNSEGYGHYHNYGYQEGNGKTFNKSTFIGDFHMGKEVFTLKPMNISSFIGDTVIDLTKAQIPYGETKIVISHFIGDVKVFVPEDMDVGISLTTSSFLGDMKLLGTKRGGFMGNAQEETPHYREAGKKVRIIVSVFIGDVKVNKVG
ncbi:cell wall-active antibiotics response protein LiaF [Paenibacillus sp. TSA_86.1]|uniref:cell wall-active antibiotics response protein LiaF n=1 Tax=Paenibacillus sp. TSA_86.1 TaxID=3415649 RepID=UPI0040453F76